MSRSGKVEVLSITIAVNLHNNIAGLEAIQLFCYGPLQQSVASLCCVVLVEDVFMNEQLSTLATTTRSPLLSSPNK